MPSQGVFSNEGVLSGDIKVLYQTINGKQHVKALNISNLDKDGDDISLSLAELDTISLPLSSSGELTTLTVLSITEKVGYYFIDVNDVILNDIADSTNSGVGISPYLAESFFYNNYNALISNAENSRTSFQKYDVDRTQGQVNPSNFDALAGFGKLTFSNPDRELYENIATVIPTKFATTTGYNTGDRKVIKSETNQFFNDRDLDLMVLEPNLIDNLGNPQISVIEPQTPDLNNLYSLIATSSFKIEIDDNVNFNNANNFYSSSSIAEQIYVDGTINSKYTPVKRTIASGSANGGNVYVRLFQEHYIQSTNDTNENIYYRAFLKSNPATNDFFDVELYFNDQQPYADLAPVQDSNYTTTGIINARYNGTKTGEEDFSGISPAVAAKPLEAALYRVDEDNNFICSQSLSDRDLIDILYEGPTEFPEVSTNVLGYLNSNTLTTTSTVIPIQGIKNRQPQPGDIFSIVESVSSNTENIQILSVAPIPSQTGFPYYNLTVQRNFDAGNGSPAGTGLNLAGDIGRPLNRLSGARLLTIDKSRLIAISNKKVWLKDNRNILKTNDRGFVVEISEVCTV